MVCGMTGSGKTCLVKQLLEQYLDTITPTPDRIIWVHAQDQPLYQDMKKSIPWIEFMCGIPENIADDDYYYVSKKISASSTPCKIYFTRTKKQESKYPSPSKSRYWDDKCILEKQYSLWKLLKMPPPLPMAISSSI